MKNNTQAFGAPHRYLNVTSNTTSNVKSGVGVLHRLVVGTVGTTSNVILYDNTSASAPIIATIATTTAGSYELNIGFNTGLTAVTAGAGAADVTFVFS